MSKSAEDDLARTARGINADTALVDAGAAYNSAALALEIAWLNLLNEAGCLTEKRQADAAAKLAAYTTALQTDLQRAGYDPGPIDGVYGPQTVAAVEKLQTDSGLPATGFVDEATARALQDKLDAVGEQESMQTAALQTVLKLAGYWDGPVDGVWTDSLTQALVNMQTALGVAPTGQVDAATVAAAQAGDRRLAGDRHIGGDGHRDRHRHRDRPGHSDRDRHGHRHCNHDRHCHDDCAHNDTFFDLGDELTRS